MSARAVECLASVTYDERNWSLSVSVASCETSLKSYWGNLGSSRHRPFPDSGVKSGFLFAAAVVEGNPNATHPSGPELRRPQPHSRSHTDRRLRIDNGLDARSEEPTHLHRQDGEFPSRTRTLLAGGGAGEAGQTCSGPISNLLQFFIRNISPVPWSSAAFPLHATSILYTSITNSCHLSPDRKYRKFQKHTLAYSLIHFLCVS